MSDYWNWYFECPYCESEVDCHVEEHDGDDRFWLTADLPDECPVCGSRLVGDWPAIEEVVRIHHRERNEKPEDDEWELKLDWERFPNPAFNYEEPQ